MGGGTWIYLGHFDFAKGENAHVELSNLSRKNGKTVTADAVKIGGGYGNIARRVDDSHIDENPGNSSINYSYTTSGYPRFTEAARYWLQWAGFPEKVYSPSQGKNDYTDDYKCRGGMGQLSGRRFGHTARQFRIERSLRPRFRFPFRCGHNQKRLDNRELRNLFYRKRKKDLWEKYSQTSFSLSHRCRIDTNRRRHTRDL